MDMGEILGAIEARRAAIRNEVAEKRAARKALSDAVKALLVEESSLPRAPVKRTRKPKAEQA